MTVGPIRLVAWGAPSLWRCRGYAISWVGPRRIISLELHLERR